MIIYVVGHKLDVFIIWAIVTQDIALCKKIVKINAISFMSGC